MTSTAFTTDAARDARIAESATVQRVESFVTLLLAEPLTITRPYPSKHLPDHLTVTCVEWRHVVRDDDDGHHDHLTVTAFGGRDNCTWWPTSETVPAWVPPAPFGWDQGVRESGARHDVSEALDAALDSLRSVRETLVRTGFGAPALVGEDAIDSPELDRSAL